MSQRLYSFLFKTNKNMNWSHSAVGRTSLRPTPNSENSVCDEDPKRENRPADWAGSGRQFLPGLVKPEQALSQSLRLSPLGAILRLRLSVLMFVLQANW